MAERRMFAKSIIDSDVFLDMPASSQNLYFHLGMRADDEGFVNAPKKIMRMIGANQNDMEILFSKRYLIGFDSGVIVIKHWKLHNTLRKDRLKPTDYQEERAQLSEKTNGAYTDRQTNDNQMTTICPPSIEEDSIDKNRIEEDKKEKNKKKPAKHKHGVFKNVLLSEDEYIKLTKDYGNNVGQMITNLDEYIEMKGKSYKNHNLVLRKWNPLKPAEEKPKFTDEDFPW